MKNEVVTTFSQALTSVLDESGFTGIRAEAPVLRDGGPQPPADVSVSIGVTGEIRGYVLIVSTTATAIALTTELGRLMGIELDEPTALGEMHRAALAELANQVSGRATIYLSEIGIDSNITPPTIVTGEAVAVHLPAGLTFHDTAVHAPAGQFTLSVGLLAG